MDDFADAGLTALVAEINARPPVTDIAILRAGGQQRARERTPGPDLAQVTDLSLPGGAGPIAARLYRPRPGPLPLLIWLHGGGWTIGGLDTHDRVCRRMADSSGVAVLAVDYRLAPEHPAPAAVDDAVAAVRWAAEAADPDRNGELGVGRLAGGGLGIDGLGIGGDSAGGTLAALACLRLRADGGPRPDLQVLVYANTDLAANGGSMLDKAHGWGLDVESITFFNRQWVPDERRWSDPAVSPLRAPDLSGLPPALIVTAEHDPLRDQAMAYASRLGDAGTPVEARVEPGLVHNFLMYDERSPACRGAADRLARQVGARLSGIRSAGR